jgi:hypothetical protein
MPEVISKHPDITIKVLEGAGAVCGQGAEQRILTKCPQERFCSTPTGEICVYGLNEIPQMTQINPAEIIQTIGGAAQEARPDPAPAQTVFGPEMIFAVLTALVAGAFLGAKLSRKLGPKQ